MRQLTNIFRSVSPRKDYVVYTVLVGHGQQLNEQHMPNRSNIDFLCFTDNDDLTSETWQIIHVDRIGIDSARESRQFKILAHDHLEEYDRSLYIDTTLQLKIDPLDIFERYLTGAKFVCFRHPWRDCVYDEAEAVIEQNYDDEWRVREQMRFYERAGFPRENGLVAGGFLLRKHHDERVKDVMKDWYYHVLRFSKRDQLSLNFVAWNHNLDYKALDFDLTDNPIFDWPVSDGPRFPKHFDGDVYAWLNPDVKRAGVDPEQHYHEYGQAEGRKTRYFQPLRINQLANRYQSDKGDLYYNRHFYSRVYEHYLKPMKDAGFTILEIGLLRHDVQGVVDEPYFSDAPSLRMWEDYFSKADILGFDIADFSGFESTRSRIVRGDQGERDDLAKIEAVLTKPLRVIIDDGSHASHHQQISLGYLFEQLEPGGLYFIEDLRYQPPQWEVPEAIKTLDLLRTYKRTGEIRSNHMTADEAAYLTEYINRVEFYDSMDYQSGAIGQDSIVVIQKK